MKCFAVNVEAVFMRNPQRRVKNSFASLVVRGIIGEK